MAPALGHLEVAGDVAVRERAPDRRRGADADGAGREVDGVGVLGAAGVALQPAELAQPRQIGLVERAEQVVDRVQHGRRVRLDRDAVGRTQMLEVQRGHDRDDRRRGGLVAADLHARIGLAHLVGVVHHAHGQPQHALLHGVEHVELAGLCRLGRPWLARQHGGAPWHWLHCQTSTRSGPPKSPSDTI